MSKYQITLTPVDKFFFGGDMTFKVGNENDEFNEKYSSYIIKSLMFPQQTSLLGMLRFLILRNAGEDVFKDGKIVNKQKAKELIGGQSFSVNKDHQANQFGNINCITGVKIRRISSKNVSDLEFAPLVTDCNFDNSSTGTYNLCEFCIPDIPKYKAKEGLSTYLTDGKAPYELFSLFKEDRRIGIDRDFNTGKTDRSANIDKDEEDDGTLFKQISYRFDNSDAQHCFVFDAEVDDSVRLEDYSGQIVSVGGDNSQFVIGISKEIQGKVIIPPLSSAIQILSPTFLQRDEARKSKFAVTNLQPFRFLESKMDSTHSYHILSRSLTRSAKYQLYAPGSVFFFEDEQQKEEFAKMIESKEDFRQIGYNEYQ